MREPAVASRLTRAAAAAVVWLRWPIVATWVAGAVAATLVLPSLSEGRGSPLAELVADDSEAARARARSAELFEVPVLAEVAVVQRDPSGLSESAQRRVVERAAAVLQHPRSGIVFALPIANTDRLFPSSREWSTTAITYLFFEPGTRPRDQASRARDFARAELGRPDDAVVGVTGAVPARLEETHRVEASLPAIEIATVAVIAAILGLTFRSPGAPLVVLVAAGLAYLATVRVLPVVGDLTGTGMPPEIEPLVVVLLLGIVTDYAIFFLAGFRGRLDAGDSRLPAARAAAAQNLPIVLTAGLIVAAGAATLLAGRLDYLRSLGPGLALTALTGLLVSVTLVPALLAILGRATWWPARVAPRAPAERGESARPAGPGGSAAAAGGRRPLGERVAYAATAKPVAAALALLAAGALVAAATGLRSTELGFTLIKGLPSDSEARVAAEAAAEGFAPGVLAPTDLLLEQRGLAGQREALTRLEGLLEHEDGVAGVVGPREVPAAVLADVVLAESGDAARIAVILADEPLGGEAIERLRALDERMPELLAEAGLPDATYAFGGDTALAENTVSLTVGDLRRIALAALGVNLLLLVAFLRSLVAPLFLLASSVLALGATLGLATYVFQGLLGYEELTYYVPFAAAVLLVSLGSDYNVFVVGRVWEEARRRPLREAIARAAPRASRAITVAGIALAASFALLALVPLRAFRELGFTLAVGVLVEAFLVRSLLVPALLSLFGDASWWPGRRRLVRRHAVAAGPEPARRADGGQTAVG